MFAQKAPKLVMKSLCRLAIDATVKHIDRYVADETLASLPQDLKNEILDSLLASKTIKNDRLEQLVDEFATSLVISPGQPNLTDLNLPCRSLQRIKISDTPVSFLAIQRLLSQNPHIISLELYNIALTGDEMLALVELCPNLGRLALRRQRALTESTLLTALQRLPLLHSVDVKLCRGVSNAAVCGIARALGTQLEELDVSYCRDVTDMSLYCLAENCPNLTRLYIEANPRITGHAVRALLQRCRRMIVLDVCNCDNLDDSLFDFAEPVQPLRLEHLNLKGCYNVSQSVATERGAVLMPAARQFILL